MMLTPVLVFSTGAGLAAAETSATSTRSPSASATATARGGEGADCHAIEMVLVNGTTESSRSASPDQDSGFWSSVAGNATRASNDVDRKYVAYDASFGGKLGDSSNATYQDSMLGGIDSAESMVSDIAKSCPD
ncbi:MAG: hypothetical protein L0H59_10300 [Tomitella sp.]|nr:hypothetical protein [Tomitella sp.]